MQPSCRVSISTILRRVSFVVCAAATCYWILLFLYRMSRHAIMPRNIVKQVIYFLHWIYYYARMNAVNILNILPVSTTRLVSRTPKCSAHKLVGGKKNWKGKEGMPSGTFFVLLSHWWANENSINDTFTVSRALPRVQLSFAVASMWEHHTRK